MHFDVIHNMAAEKIHHIGNNFFGFEGVAIFEAEINVKHLVGRWTPAAKADRTWRGLSIFR